MSRQDADTARATLYDKSRLEKRLALFEQLALPSITAQTDQNFQTAVLIGDTFPEDFSNRLDSLLEGIANVHLVRLPRMIHIKAVRRAFAMLPDREGTTHTATFRLDDDDAIHCDTIGRIHDLGTMLLRDAQCQKNPFVISFNRGFYVGRQGKDKVEEFYEKTPVAVGMALVAPNGDKRNVFRRNHRRANQYFNCYSDMHKPMFIRTSHGGNDSEVTPSGRRGDLGADAIRRHLAEGFGQTAEKLLSLVRG